jgi:phosphoglucomutase
LTGKIEYLDKICQVWYLSNMAVIKFGTDGWRAKMGEEFTFENVRIFAYAYSNYLKKKFRNKSKKNLCVIVNYDTRFLSEEFALEAAKIFSLNGIKTWMPERDAPLAPVSLAIVRNKCCGGVNITASFNKPIYNGIKVFTNKGIPALPAETDLIEKEVEKIAENFCFKPQYSNKDFIAAIDVKTAYIEYIEKLIDFDLIKRSGIKVVVDNLYGTSREYLDYILNEHEVDILSIHNFPYSTFGGVISSCDKDSLRDLSKLVVQQRAHLGLATDIDGDRFGIIDSQGRFLCSNTVMPPLIEYLITVRKMQGGIVKSISTTNNIRKVAEYYDRKIYSTPVGFKYLASELDSKDAFIAVESTNGASLNGEIKIKDGILFSLLITEMLAYYQLDMGKVLKDFYLRFPKLYSDEISIIKNESTESRYKELFSRKNFDLDFKDMQLKEVDYIDGIKFRFDDSWLLIRTSGTSDVLRLYAESPGLKHTKDLIKKGRSFIE